VAATSKSVHDPAPFECPVGGCQYDFGRRAPVHTACPCGRLVCRKCAGVAAGLPSPSPCFVCGRVEGVREFDTADCAVDRGVLLALIARAPPVEVYVRLPASDRVPSMFFRW
jgi:hypothetical protein